MTYKLWIDDERSEPEGWVVAKSFWDVKKIVVEKGFPSEVSFDYTLSYDYRMPTGFDCAQYLIGEDMIYGTMPKDFKYHAHSSSSTGRERITKVMDEYLKEKLK